jgi:hypothetical protein
MKGPIKNQGKGSVIIIIEDPKKTILGREIDMKYLGTLDHPIVRMILHSMQEGKPRSY